MRSPSCQMAALGFICGRRSSIHFNKLKGGLIGMADLHGWVLQAAIQAAPIGAGIGDFGPVNQRGRWDEKSIVAMLSICESGIARSNTCRILPTNPWPRPS